MLNFYWTKTITIPSGRKVTFGYPTLADAEKLMNFINPIIEEPAHILMNEVQSLEEEKKYLQECVKKMEKGQMIKIAAFFENRIVGVCDVTKRSYKKSHIAGLGISLSKDFRGEGLGKMLMEEAMNQAKKYLGVSQIVLTCSALNVPAMKLYEKIGFKEYGRLPDGIFSQGTHADQVFMYKKVQ